MTEAADTRDVYGRARPRLREGVETRRNGDGDVVIADRRGEAYMGVRPGEEPLLAFLDGQHDLNDLVARGMKQTPRIRPMGVLELLRRLYRSGLIEGVDDVAERLFGVMDRKRSKLAEALARILDVRLHLGVLRFPLEVGRLLPRAFWPLFHVIAAWSLLAAIGVGISQGRVWDLLQPFPRLRAAETLTLLAILYLSGVAVLSVRGLIRGLLLRSRGVVVRAAGLRVLWGVVHLDIDDRERRASTRSDRTHLALGGISSFALLAGLGGLAHYLWTEPLGRLVASVANIALLLDLAPYLRTDGRQLIGILTRVSGMRRRSSSFLLRRAFVRAFHRDPLDSAEKRYLLVSCLWLAHAALVIHLLGERALPGAMDLVKDALTGKAAGGDALPTLAAGVALAAFLGTAVLGLAVGLVVVFGSLVLQVARPPEKSEPLSSVEVDDSHRAAFIDHIKQIPFFSLLENEYVDQIFSRMRLEVYGEGNPVIKQGEEGKRFYFIERGRAAVEVTESSGLTHEAARLGPGDFFGEVALLENVPRTATVRAIDRLEVLSLAGYVFRELLDQAGVSSADVRSGIRNAAFLRHHPLFATVDGDGMRKLLQGLVERRFAPGEVAVRQGEVGSSLFVIREGRFDVEVRTDDAHTKKVASLDESDYFGEIAVMSGMARTATVTATAPSIVLEVSDTLFRDVLMGNFQAVLQLDQGCADRLELLRMI
jgi:CRP-like cAMP-binding protein